MMCHMTSFKFWEINNNVSLTVQDRDIVAIIIIILLYSHQDVHTSQQAHQYHAMTSRNN